MPPFDRYAYPTSIVRVWVSTRANAAYLARCCEHSELRVAHATLLRTMQTLGRALLDLLPARPDLRRSVLESAMALHDHSTGFRPERAHDAATRTACLRTTGAMASLLFAQARDTEAAVAEAANAIAVACDRAVRLLIADTEIDTGAVA